MFNLKTNYKAIIELIAILNKNIKLIYEVTKKEIKDQHSGQIFGVFWFFLHPLVMISIYVFLFAFVFKTKIDDGREMPYDYTIYILSGLIPWLCLQNTLSRASVLFSSKTHLIKNIVFPIVIFPAQLVLLSNISFIFSLVLLFIYVVFSYSSIHLTYLLLPFLIICQTLFALGISYALASTGVFVKDLKDIIQVGLLFIMYLTPIFYLPQWVPALFKPILLLNPISSIVWCYQDALYYGKIVHPVSWFVFPLISIITFSVGYRIYKKLSPYFSNVM
jgi:lipopolysaccharide transport system permease protein